MLCLSLWQICHKLEARRGNEFPDKASLPEREPYSPNSDDISRLKQFGKFAYLFRLDGQRAD